MPSYEATIEREMTVGGSATGRSADGEELRPALRPKLIPAERRTARELFDDGALDRADGGLGVTMGAAERFSDDAVDHPQRLEVRGRDPHRLGGLARLVG